MPDLNEFQKITVDRFRGLYQRGVSDECPQDHACCCENVQFSRVGNFGNVNEFITRPGTRRSFSPGKTLVRLFLATFNDGSYSFLSLDNAGNIRNESTGLVLYTDINIVDFSAINLFNKVYIFPICATFPPTEVLVWDNINPVRKAGCLPPSSTFAAADGIADLTGGLNIGVHLFAVAFVTNTGFISPPGPYVGGGYSQATNLMSGGVFTPTSYTAPGQKKVNLTGIPTGPSEVVARWILVTRANENLFFFAPGGFINDNTTVNLTLDFFDTALSVDADYLFDLLVRPPGGNNLGGGVNKFHNRLILVPGDLVRVSRPDDAESFDNVTGFIQLPSEKDGNIARGCCAIQDSLYFTKSVGIISAEDNGQDPVNWPLVVIDGGVGAYQPGITTVTGSQPSLSKGNIFLLCDRGGIYIFNGTVQYPQLTWKIDDVWKRISRNYLHLISTCVDIYGEFIYVIIPVDNSSVTNLLLVGDFSEGLDWQNIKWTFYTFPWGAPRAISMMNVLDIDGIMDWNYYLRIAGSDGNIHKVGAIPADYLSSTPYPDDEGTPIAYYYQHGLVTPKMGSVSIFRHLRSRARFVNPSAAVGNLNLSLLPEDLQTSVAQPAISMAVNFPGKDLDRQINFENEKMAVQISGTVPMAFSRLDIFTKERHGMRPG